MYSYTSKIGWVIIQLSLLATLIVIDPLLLFIFSAGLLIVLFLIRKPGLTLITLSVTAVVKGFLLDQISFFKEVDLTLIIVLLLWVGVAWKILHIELKVHRSLYPLLALVSVFTIYLALTGFYTPSPGYGLIKILRFSFITCSMFFVPILIVNDPSDSIRLLTYLKWVISLVVLAIIGQLLYMTLSGQLLGYFIRISLPGSNPIAIARFLSLGAILIIVIFMHQQLRKNLLLVPALLIILFVLILTQSRGPIAAVIVSAIFYAIFIEKTNRRKFIVSSVVMLTFIGILLILLPENFTYRFFQYSSADTIITPAGIKGYNTIGSRLDFWNLSLMTWASSLKNIFVGLGSGGFSSLFIWRDFTWYPHNMFFEILVELGIIGIGLIIAVIMAIIKTISRAINKQLFSNVTSQWVAALLVTFISAQFSGDINDNRVLWLFAGITIATISTELMNKSTKNNQWSTNI